MAQTRPGCSLAALRCRPLAHAEQAAGATSRAAKRRTPAEPVDSRLMNAPMRSAHLLLDVKPCELCTGKHALHLSTDVGPLTTRQQVSHAFSEALMQCSCCAEGGWRGLTTDILRLLRVCAGLGLGFRDCAARARLHSLSLRSIQMAPQLAGRAGITWPACKLPSTQWLLRTVTLGRCGHVRRLISECRVQGTSARLQERLLGAVEQEHDRRGQPDGGVRHQHPRQLQQYADAGGAVRGACRPMPARCLTA